MMRTPKRLKLDPTSVGISNVQYIALRFSTIKAAGFAGPEPNPDEQGEPANDIDDFIGDRVIGIVAARRSDAR